MQTIHRIDSKKTSAKTLSFAEPLEQRIAPAGVFRWNATGGGAWNSPANWALVSGDIGQGFPDGAGDEAQFTNAITANSVITIPDNVDITLGKLKFDDNNSYTITSQGSGRITMFNSFAEATIISTNANGTASHIIQAPIWLANDTTFINSTNSPLVIQTSINEVGPYRSVTKDGTGVVTFAGAAANTYTGQTTVYGGVLHLAKNEGISAIGSGQLSIGSLQLPGVAKVVLDASEQIPAASTVTLIGDAIFDLANNNESLSALTLVDEAAVTTGTGILSVNRIVAGNYSAGVTPTISGVLNLTGEASILVPNTPAAKSYLNISAVIKGSQGLTKIGDGVLELSTAVAQQYTGTTTITQGTLLLNTITADAGISTEILIEKDGVLRVANSFEIPDTASVAIVGGRLEAAFTEDFRHLALDGGTVSVETGATFSIRKGGSVTVSANLGSKGSSIEGSGTFRLMEDPVPFIINETADDADLKISLPMTGLLSTAGILKIGDGNLVLAANGSYLGGNYVAAGTFTFNGTQSSRITLTGGTITGSSSDVAYFDGLLASGGRIVPNYNFKSTGNVAMNSGTVFAPYYNTGVYDLEVEGTVDITGAKLDFSALTVPGDGYLQKMVIIDNDGADAVVGTFEGLAEGAILKTPRGNFTISYVGGTGNDVSLTPVYVAPTILPGGKAATFIDVDGDMVTVRVSKGTLTADNFKLLATGEGAQLKRLTLDDPSFEGTSLKLTATPKNGLGDRQVDLGYLDASVDFTTISIPGDVGYFDIGSSSTPTPAFKSMSVKSIGYSEPSAAQATYVSKITGNFGNLKVKGDLFGTSVVAGDADTIGGSIVIGGSLLAGTTNGSAGLYVGGKIGKLSIAGDIVGGSGSTTLRVIGTVGKFSVGGSIIGGSGFESGFVRLSETAGSVNIGGSIIGADGVGSGTLTLLKSANSVKIGGSVVGGEHEGTGRVAITGDVKTFTLGQDLRGSVEVDAGAVFVEGVAGAVKIGGSIVGGASGSGLYAKTFGSIAVGRDITGTDNGRAVICALGVTDPVDAKSALAIASLTVGRDVNQADILAGYDRSIQTPAEADVQIGKIAVKGDWSASRALTGIRSIDGYFGNENDQPFVGGSAEIASRIASILIQGSVRGTIGLGDSYGFVSEEIGALSVGGKKIILNPAAKDAVAFGSFGDTTAREV